MTDSTNAETERPAEPPKRRNPLERVVVWGLIIGLGGLAWIEYRAKTSYDASVQGLQQLSDGVRDVTLDEARQQMVGYSTVDGPITIDGSQAYRYSWFSLLKGETYKLDLLAAADQHTLKTFSGPSFAEDPDVVASRIAAANAENHDAEPPFIGAGPFPTDGTPNAEESEADAAETASESPAPPRGAAAQPSP